jgi:hypothetical protein
MMLGGQTLDTVARLPDEVKRKLAKLINFGGAVLPIEAFISSEFTIATRFIQCGLG